MKRTLLLIAAFGLFSTIPGVSSSHVTICHFPPGNPANVQIITVGAAAVPSHVGNHAGDKIFDGSCLTQSGVEG